VTVVGDKQPLGGHQLTSDDMHLRPTYMHPSINVSCGKKDKNPL